MRSRIAPAAKASPPDRSACGIDDGRRLVGQAFPPTAASRNACHAENGLANGINVHLNLRPTQCVASFVEMLTDRQRSVLDFIQSEQREKGITPSTREIQNHFGFASQTSVMQYLSTLERKGFLDRHARKARALVTPVQKVRITDIPIYGQIPAGMATLTEQTVLGHVSLDARSANASRNARMFALKVRGDSMVNAHILDGDVVILDDRKEARNGDIVAALIDGETTLKRFVIEHGRPYLRAENPRYPDQRPAHDLRIQGVMVSLIRRQPNGGTRQQASSAKYPKGH
jgi:repressor LexA